MKPTLDERVAYPAHEALKKRPSRLIEKCIGGEEITHSKNALIDEFNALRSELKLKTDALKKIAKPALGGKMQQYIAQEALTPKASK